MRPILYFNCLILLLITVAGCGADEAPPPSPTASFFFATITPAGTEISAEPTREATPEPSQTNTPTVTLTPVVITATPVPRPIAVVNSPNGFLSIHSGPGLIYPPLGTYDNGVVAEVVGKQYDANDDLWWLIRFSSDKSERGWIFAGYTQSEHVDEIPWVTAPPVPTPVVTPVQPTPTPHAVINSPDGVLIVRSGPGRSYEPPLGSYNNGVTVPILGKQFAPDDNSLWWLIPFSGSPQGQGWIFANFTIARSIEAIPLVTAPPTPTPIPSPTPTYTPTPRNPAAVTWTISGRVIDEETAQAINGASVQAVLGADRLTLLTVTAGDGTFSLTATARDAGDLTLTLIADNYIGRTVTVAPVSPRSYNFPALELTPQQTPAITWAISGRVIEAGGERPVAGAIIEATLGADGLTISTRTAQDGTFLLRGEASNKGNLTLKVSATGYQDNIVVSQQTESRLYTFPKLQLIPLAESCVYERLLRFREGEALARLAQLQFTTVSTTVVPLNNDPTGRGLILSQQPEPPPEGQTLRLNCHVPIILGVGGEGP